MKYYVSLFKVIFTLSIAIMITMFIRVELLNFTNIKESPRYLVASMRYSNSSFDVPYFKDKIFRDVVSKYVLNNECENLKYNIKKLDSQRSSLFLNCGKPESFVFDFSNKKVLSFDDIISDKINFNDIVKKLLYLKYPYFVVEDITKSTYEVKKYEIKGYYETKEFGNLTLKINNNVIKDMLNYKMEYTDTYKNEVFMVDKTKKLIAFTYDDGPSLYDLNTIDILNRSHFKATFFVVGNRLDDYNNVLKLLSSSNMEVGNHTVSHKYLASLNEQEALDEIIPVNDKYKSITNNELKLFRPSYGAYNKEVVKKLNMPVILWSIDTLDWKTKNTNLIYKSVINDARDGDIVLMHSLYESTEKATEKLVKDLYKKGFIVVSVSDLMMYKGITLNPGEAYHCANCGRDY